MVSWNGELGWLPCFIVDNVWERFWKLWWHLLKFISPPGQGISIAFTILGNTKGFHFLYVGPVVTRARSRGRGRGAIVTRVVHSIPIRPVFTQSRSRESRGGSGVGSWCNWGRHGSGWGLNAEIEKKIRNKQHQKKNQ
jgi:hypothetical protein